MQQHVRSHAQEMTLATIYAVMQNSLLYSILCVDIKDDAHSMPHPLFYKYILYSIRISAS